MVAIVLLLSVTAGSMFLGMGDLLEQSPPVAVSDVTSEWDVGSSNPTQYLEIRHEAGSAIDAEHLSIQYRTDSGSKTVPAPTTGDLSDGTWEGGEIVRVPVDEDAICGGSDDEVALRLIYNDGDRSVIVSRHTVPIRASAFDIRGGQVVPKHDYTTEITIVGSAITYGTSGSNVPVEVGVEVGGTPKATPWPSDVNDGANPRSVTYTGQSADAGIAVTARSYDGGTIIAASSTDGTDQVVVLRDGDPVPTVGGFAGQPDAESYLTPYISGGRIDLQPNQAIFLFELGTTDTTSDAFDRQDAVVVATMWSESSTPVFVEGTSSEHEVICPRSP